MTTGAKDLFYERVAAYVKWARARRKLTVSQVATAAGVQYNHVKQVESGNRFQFHQVQWLVEVLGIDIVEMLRFANTKPELGAASGKEESDQEESDQEESVEQEEKLSFI